MKRFFGQIVAALMVVATLGFASCRGQEDINDGLNDGTNDPMAGVDEVPEGVLRLFADKTTIMADGNDTVTFVVMFGSEDVSEARTLQLVRNGKLCNYGEHAFSTTVAGTYTFTAEFYRSGRYYSDNEVTIEVTPIASGDEKKYVQQTLGYQFTSVGCTSCPFLASSIKQIQSDFPNRLVPVAFHQDFQVEDEMSHPMTALYYKQIKRDGLPQFNANLIIDNDYITVSEYDQIVAILDRVEKNYPATCGVAIESSLNESERKVTVRAKITSNTPSVYRYQIFLVEDGYKSMQMGSNEAGNYVHNNIVRVVASDGVDGMVFNEGMAMHVGVEATAERTLDIPRGYELANMRVVVAALSSYNNGDSYVTNNCATCPLNGSVDYLIQE